MRLLIVSEFYTPYHVGGAEFSVQLLAESLQKQGHEVHVYTSGIQEFDEEINGVLIHRRLQHNLYWTYQRKGVSHIQKTLWHCMDMYNFRTQKDFATLIHEIKPDVIHTNVFAGFSPSIWHIAKKMHIPVVHTLRDYNLMCIKSTMYKMNSECVVRCVPCKVLTFYKKMLSQSVDAVVGISQYILQKHLDFGYFKNTKKRAIVPNSVRTPQISLMKRRIKVIGFLGRIHPSKGVEFLIESFLAIDRNDYVLQIAGSGEQGYIDMLKKKYVSERVVFLGRVDAYLFLNSISLLVVPSLWNEPFGRVIIEANVCNVPVLVSNRGGMPELIEEGVNGNVFKLEEKNDLKTKLMDFMNGKHTYNLSEMTLEEYTEKSIANKYLDIYSQILNKGTE